jgi:hypothetical protein
MNQVLNGLDGVQCMLDDMIIMGSSDEMHLHNLRNVLQRLQNYGLRTKLQKCYFLKEKITYRRHEISAEGLRKMTDKIQAVRETLTPKNVKELRAFLGLVNYYRRFLSNSATVLKPLNELLEKDRKWTGQINVRKRLRTQKQ